MTNTSFHAIVVASKHIRYTLSELVEAIGRIAPTALVGNWDGPLAAQPEAEQSNRMLSIDGIKLAILNFDTMLPVELYETGSFPNYLMPDLLQKLSDNRAHITITAFKDHMSTTEALAKARAVTIAARAIGTIVGALAVQWGAAFSSASLLARASAVWSPPALWAAVVPSSSSPSAAAAVALSAAAPAAG